MCDDKLFLKMKALQVKPEQLHCTQSSSCWCNQLSFRFPLNQIQDDCMSPQQMLDTFESQLDKHDKIYLNSLLNREFVNN
jgi:hypothetical protein